MKIGELAQRAGILVQTVRYYERAGLLPTPSRSGGNFRQYGAADAERLNFIRRCRALDMTLDEIRALLRFKDQGGADCGDVDALLDEHISHVTERIAELQGLKKELRQLRDQCGRRRAIAECGILRGLSARQPDGRGRADTGHVPGSHSHRG